MSNYYIFPCQTNNYFGRVWLEQQLDAYHNSLPMMMILSFSHPLNNSLAPLSLRRVFNSHSSFRETLRRPTPSFLLSSHRFISLSNLVHFIQSSIVAFYHHFDTYSSYSSDSYSNHSIPFSHHHWLIFFVRIVAETTWHIWCAYLFDNDNPTPSGLFGCQQIFTFMHHFCLLFDQWWQ